MTERCSICGADLAMVGRAHRCVPRLMDSLPKGVHKMIVDKSTPRASTKLPPPRPIDEQRGRSSTVERRPSKPKTRGSTPPARSKKSTAAKGRSGTRASPRSASRAAEGAKGERADFLPLMHEREGGPSVTPASPSAPPKPRADVKRLGSRGPAPGTGGRPKKGDEAKTLQATKPWLAEGISQATWYRRRAAQRRERDYER